MKKIITAITMVLLTIPAFGNQLEDNFDDGILDTSLWDVYLPTWSGVEFAPLANSALTESGGVVNFNDGAILTTKDHFPTPTIEGSFRIYGWEYDRFKVNLRSDGEIDNHWQSPIGGIGVQFVLSSNPDYSGQGNIQIRDFKNDGVSSGKLAEASYTLEANTFYDFKIVDDGLNVSVFIDGSLSPVLSFDTDIRYGDGVGFSNREFLMVPETVDYYQLHYPWDTPADVYFTDMREVVITSPEPTALAFLISGGLWMVLLRNKE